MKLKFAVLACLSSIFILNGCSRTTVPADVEYDHTQNPYHTVRKGDSIASIAQKYNMNKKELVRLNGIKPPYKIFVGQKLLVKTAASAKIAKEAEIFDTPATEEKTEMRGDVEVTTLQPLQGTEPHDQTHLSEEPVQPLSDEEVAAADNASVTENDQEGKPLNTAKMPASASSYVWPVKGKIIKGFKTGKFDNDGINISAPKGTPVSAANNGIVAHTGNQVAGLGNLVLIKHPNGYMTVYTHLDDIKVRKGQQVSAGDKIGTVGKTGNVKEPQLHFEIRNGKTPIDPTDYLN